MFSAVGWSYLELMIVLDFTRLGGVILIFESQYYRFLHNMSHIFLSLIFST